MHGKYKSMFKRLQFGHIVRSQSAKATLAKHSPTIQKGNESEFPLAAIEMDSKRDALKLLPFISWLNFLNTFQNFRFRIGSLHRDTQKHILRFGQNEIQVKGL